MKFTCLSKGWGFNFPPCHVLNVCGFRVLFDVPLDLSALAIFSPVPIALCSPDSELVAGDLISSEPLYKTLTSLQSWDVSSIDVVLISNPMGILGLPFLTRTEGFSAEIFATEATAQLGRLLLEDLVSLNMEFRQFYGAEESRFPPQINCEDLDRLPSPLKEIALGKDVSDSGSWMALYSAGDVKDCIRKISSLRHAEETCFNGTLVIKAFCSGLDLGSCNWAITSPKGDIAFVSGSVFSSGHAMSFDHRALEGSDLILFSDFSPLHAIDDVENVMSLNGSSSPRSLYSGDDYSEEEEKLGFVCSCAIDAVKAGGSVLVPINRIGTVLLLLEQISASLEISDLKIPIYFISSMAEELLAYTNVIPEWLCKERQEKLFSGEASFAHATLIKEKKLHIFPAVHSPELLTMWREPCIVFSPSWSLRLGPAVHLLHRWCGDPNSLLVLENGMDAELALLPYKPMEMKVLQCSFLSGMKMKNVQPLLEALQPKHVLLPIDFEKVDFLPKPALVPALHYYEENKTVCIARLKSPEIEIPMDLATQFRFKKLKNQEHVSIARLKGEVVIRHGKHGLVSVEDHPGPKSQPLLFWGSPEAESLLSALSKMGIKGSLENPSRGSESDGFALVIVNICEPFIARIQIRATSTLITTSDDDFALKLAEAICSNLSGI